MANSYLLQNKSTNSTRLRLIVGEIPSTWGKQFWETAQVVASRYPINPTEEDKNHFRAFFNSFQHILPCAECRNHYKLIEENFPLMDENLSSREAICDWLRERHNMVNTILNKKINYTKQNFADQYDINEKFITKTEKEKTKSKVINKVLFAQEANSPVAKIPSATDNMGIVKNKTPHQWKTDKSLLPQAKTLKPAVPIGKKEKTCSCKNKKGLQ